VRNGFVSQGQLAAGALEFLTGIPRERPAGTREALPGTKSKRNAKNDYRRDSPLAKINLLWRMARCDECRRPV